jgi:hypothetical protein
LFRRGNSYFCKQEYTLARDDLRKAAKLMPKDRSIAMLLQQIEDQIAIQNKSEQSFYSRMFG